jgi:hypothetical protein
MIESIKDGIAKDIISIGSSGRIKELTSNQWRRNNWQQVLSNGAA